MLILFVQNNMAHRDWNWQLSKVIEEKQQQQ